MADNGKLPKPAMPLSLVKRGEKGSSPLGTIVFVGLRAIDPFLQYNLLTGWGTSLLARFGLVAIEPIGPVVEVLGSRLPLPQLLLLVMAVGSTAKQTYWLTRLSQERFGVGAALLVSIANTTMNTINSLLLLAPSTSALSAAPFPGTTLPWPFVAGPIIYALGMFLETASEIQRRAFKDEPRNRGKAMRGGLWSLARHINYGGHTLWRGAYAMTASGAVAGLLEAAAFVWDFGSRAVPELEEYCAGRYGQQWAAFVRDVRWILLPGIY